MESGQEQLLLVADPGSVKRRAAQARSTAKKVLVAAATAPIAQVRVDIPVAHLDRDFDYLVPESLDATARVGAKVRVRFRGKLTDAVIVNRVESSEYERLSPIERVIGPALTPETLELVMAVTERYAGLLWDVIRAAVPTKHGKAVPQRSEVEPVSTNGDPHAWDAYDHGEWLVSHVRTGAHVRGCWTSAPASDWRGEIRELINAALTGDSARGVLVVVPDAKDVAALAEVCREFNPTLLLAERGAAQRYAAFIDIIEGRSSLVIGTRSAIFAPVHNLSLLIVWDDGNDNLSEPHAPYWDAREVAAMRSHEHDCSLIVGGHSRSVVTQSWCDAQWAREINPSEPARKAVQGRIRGMYPEDSERDPARARIPHKAWLAVKAAVEHGPVLIQVARKGYISAFVCKECGERAVCQCGGGMTIERSGAERIVHCQRCGSSQWRCSCGGRDIRALSIGAERTAEEIGRAFPGVPVLWSQSEKMINSVDGGSRIVVATPGAEPIAHGGYRAVIVLDATTTAISLLAQESLIRRVFGAAVLAAPGAEIVIVAPAEDRVVQSVSRWDAPWAARRELAERDQAHLPPHFRVAQLNGTRKDIDQVISEISSVAELSTMRILGPVEESDKVRAFLLVARSEGRRLTQELTRITRIRSADSHSGHVQIRIDPRDF